MNDPMKVKSSTLALLVRLKFWTIMTPWKIDVDLANQLITIKKRNWFLIGTDEQVYKFNTVRNVKIDRHLFGADISIKIYAGEAKVYCIPKKRAIEIRDILLTGKEDD